MDIAIPITFSIVLILGNGYFSAAELAVVSSKKMRLEQARDEGNPRAQAALEVGEDSDALFATIQVYITLLGFFASAVSATTLSGPFSAWMRSLGVGWLTDISAPLATVIITLIVSYVTIVVGEVFPKRLGWAHPEAVSMALAPSLKAFSLIAKPLVKLTAGSSEALARLFHVGSPEDHNAVSEDEIKVLVADNEDLLPDEKRMIHEILDMSETVARDIMTPRTDIIFAEDNETVKQTLDRMRGTGYSRLPVFHENQDRITGVVKFKDLLPAVLDDREDDLVGDYTTEAFFVPETKDIFPMLSEMQTNRQQMAIAVDEYGGVSGLITIEDIVEEIVGEIVDETDMEGRYITRLTDTEWLVDGSLPVEDAVESGLPLVESDEYETIAGWLIDLIDTIPQVGEDFEYEGYRFTVQNMRRNRIQVIRVEKLSQPESAHDGAEGDSSK
ncbi:hemolysin family protein [Curtanaerobium respiraculi]|uniref:hemolysin family protein n=1 Tax=Curtanaerobium respiraculi TaxID=2949669 RepID=UPI0024B35DE8|nr:hemolysin family protein [Curtanaerobium respiraculi]